MSQTQNVPHMVMKTICFNSKLIKFELEQKGSGLIALIAGIHTTQRLASQCFGLEFLPSKPLVNSDTELEHLTAYTQLHLLYALLPILSPVCQ